MISDQTNCSGLSGEATGMVVGVDCSTSSAEALKWAEAHGARFGKITPATSWHYPGAITFTPETMNQLARDLERIAEQEVELMLIRVSRGVRDPLVLSSEPPYELLTRLGKEAALIVVGTRGRGALADTILGSTSLRVAANTQTPVAIVPSGVSAFDSNHRVVVGIDGSPNSVEALIWAIKNVPVGTVIDAVHVWNYSVILLPSVAVVKGKEFREGGRDLLKRSVDEALAATSSNRSVRRRLIFGDPRNVLQALSATADMLVIGTRGTTGVAHLLQGSTTTSLIHKPSVVTIVVPAKAESVPGND